MLQYMHVQDGHLSKNLLTTSIFVVTLHLSVCEILGKSHTSDHWSLLYKQVFQYKFVFQTKELFTSKDQGYFLYFVYRLLHEAEFDVDFICIHRCMYCVVLYIDYITLLTG